MSRVAEGMFLSEEDEELQMFAFIETNSRVLTAETRILKVEGILTVFARVSYEARDGSTKTSKWQMLGMDERTALERLARKAGGTLWSI